MFFIQEEEIIMSTLQNTISMMETLPETDLIKIQKFTKKLSQRHELEAALSKKNQTQYSQVIF